MEERGERLVNQIELLVDLQTVDQQLREHTDVVEALRRRVAELEAELDERGKIHEACRTEQAELDKRRRELEQLLSEEENKMKDRRMRLMRIRNEKEAAAIRREIEVGKEGNHKIENDLIDCLESLEDVGAREVEARSACEALEARHREQQAAADAEIGALSEGMEQIRRRREDLAVAIDGTLRRQYETVAARRHGLAVVEVRGGTCQGCHMRVAPQLVNEIQRNARVVACPNCHRILYCRAEPAVSEA